MGKKALDRQGLEKSLKEARNALNEHSVRLGLAADALSGAEAVFREAQERHREVRAAFRETEDRIDALQRAMNLEPQTVL